PGSRICTSGCGGPGRSGWGGDRARSTAGAWPMRCWRPAPSSDRAAPSKEETEMAEAYIIHAGRRPVGKRGGGMAQAHPAHLGAHGIRALVDRTGVDPGAVEDVIFGCCDTIGPQAGDIARTCWLAAGLPEHVPGVTIDRQCGSSQQSVHFAAQAVMS